MSDRNVTVRASQAGAFSICPRFGYYVLAGFEPGPPSELTERAFVDGNIHEPSVLAYAEKALNGVIRERQKELSFNLDGITITGHVDGIIEADECEAVVEAKALSARGFASILDEGIKSFPQYLVQVNLYMHGLGIKKAFLVVRNKETPRYRHYDHCIIELDYDADVVAETVRIIREVLDMVEKQEPPERLTPPSWKCSPSWCEYYELCYEGVGEADRPPAKRVVVPPEDVAETIVRLAEAREERAELEREIEHLEGLVRSYLEHEKKDRARVGDIEVSRILRTRETVDYARIKALPEEIKQGLMRVTTYEMLKVRKGVK